MFNNADSYLIMPKLKTSLPKLSHSYSRDNSIDTSSDESLLPLKSRSVLLKTISNYTKSQKITHLLTLFEQLDSKLIKSKICPLWIQVTKSLNMTLDSFIDHHKATLATLQELKSQYEGQSKTLSNYDSINHKLSETIQIQNKYGFFNAVEIQSQQKRQNIKINQLTLENTGLKTEIEQLSIRLEKIEIDSDIQLLKSTISDLQHQLADQKAKMKAEIFDKDAQVKRLNALIRETNSTVQRMESENKAFQIVMDEQTAQMKQLQFETWRAKDHLASIQETMKMQIEDNRERTIMYYEDKLLQHKLREKLKQLQYKFDRMQIERSKEIDVPENREYREQVLHMMMLGQYFKKDPSYFVSKVEVSDLKASVSSSFFGEDEIDYRFTDYNFQYSLPSHFILIEHFNKVYEDEIQGIQYRRIDPQFFIYIRTIMDAYWIHILMNLECMRQIPRFAEFVYHWFQNFSIDRRTRQVIRGNSNEKIKPDQKYLRFIIDLQSPELQKVWEIAQFKKLIDDQYTRDEEFFFFYYRFTVFRGPVMSRDNPAATIIYVPLSYGEVIIDMALQKYDYYTVLQAKTAIRKHCRRIRRFKEEVQLVDGWWIMTILMQFYETEKKFRFSWVQIQFAKALGLSRPSRRGVSFQIFSKIMSQAFPDTPWHMVVQLYRESYALNPGVGVTPENFMVAATESHFLTTQLSIYKHSLFNPLSREELTKQKDEKSSPEFLKYIKLLSYKFDSPQQFADMHLLQLGSTTILDDFSILGKFIHDQQRGKGVINLNFQMHHVLHTLTKVKLIKQFQQSLLQKDHRIQFFYNLEQVVAKSAFKDTNFNTVFISHGQPAIEPFDELKDIVAQIQTVMKSFEKFQICHNATHLEKSRRIRPLQKLIKRKLAKFYGFISSLLSSKLRLMKQHQIEEVKAIKSPLSKIDLSKDKKSIVHKAANILLKRTGKRNSTKQEIQ